MRVRVTMRVVVILPTFVAFPTGMARTISSLLAGGEIGIIVAIGAGGTLGMMVAIGMDVVGIAVVAIGTRVVVGAGVVVLDDWRRRTDSRMFLMRSLAFVRSNFAGC